LSASTPSSKQQDADLVHTPVRIACFRAYTAIVLAKILELEWNTVTFSNIPLIVDYDEPALTTTIIIYKEKHFTIRSSHSDNHVHTYVRRVDELIRNTGFEIRGIR